MQLSDLESWEIPENEICSICQDDFTNETNDETRKERLFCGHCFHLGCIRLMHDDRCPLCRAHLLAPNITDSEIRKMRMRHMDDINNAHREAIFEGQETVVPIGSQIHRAAMVHLFSHKNGSDIGRMELGNLIEECHEALHNGPLHTHESRFDCAVVDNFIVDMYECMHKHADEVVLDTEDELFQEVLTWFCERLVVSPRDETLHQAAHHVFETVSCEHLHQYARTAVRVLIGAELVDLSMNDLSMNDLSM